MEQKKFIWSIIQGIDQQVPAWRVIAIMILSLVGACLFIAGLVMLDENELKQIPDSILLISLGASAFFFFLPFMLCLVLIKAVATLQRNLHALESTLGQTQPE